MSLEQFRFGLEIIDHALQEELSKNKVHKASFEHKTTQTNPPYAIYSVTVNGQTEEAIFNYEDVADSHSGLTPGAKAKIEILAYKVACLPGSTNPFAVSSGAFTGIKSQGQRATEGRKK